MTEAEASELFDKLLATLRERRNGLSSEGRSDFLKAIEAEIDAGKPVQVKLKVRGEKVVSDPVVGVRSSGATASGEFIQRQEYSSVEKLEILVNGLALATVTPPLMAQKFVNILDVHGPGETNIRVRLGDDQADSANYEIDEGYVQDTVHQTAVLKELLAEISQEIRAFRP